MSTPKERRKIERYLNIRDKVAGVNYYTDTMLNKTITMFKYNNLPESLPERSIELMLQTDGKCIVTDWNNTLIALDGNYAPPLDGYYRSGYFIVANPWADINHTFKLVNQEVLIRNEPAGEHKPAVLLRNDPLERGLLPIMWRYGALLTETDLTMYLADVNFRTIYNIVANTDREMESAQIYLKEVEEGKQGVMLEEDLSNGIKTNPYANGTQGYITQIIELEQYLRGTFLNEIGLNANYNMKRERLSANETELNEDSLRPLIDVMLEERQKACDEINRQFGTNISVEFGSAWAKYNPDNDLSLQDSEEVIINDDEVTEDDSNNGSVAEDAIGESGEDSENGGDAVEEGQGDPETEEAVAQEEEERETETEVEINVNVNADEVNEVETETTDEDKEDNDDEDKDRS